MIKDFDKKVWVFICCPEEKKLLSFLSNRDDIIDYYYNWNEYHLGASLIQSCFLTNVQADEINKLAREDAGVAYHTILEYSRTKYYSK